MADEWATFIETEIRPIMINKPKSLYKVTLYIQNLITSYRNLIAVYHLF